MSNDSVTTGHNPEMKPPFLVRRRTLFTWVVPLLLLVANLLLRPTYGGWPAYGAGVALVVLGEVVRFWANGYIAKDQEVTTGGPYAHVRNPLYFGSLLLSIGYGLVSGFGWIGVAMLLALFLVFHLAAIKYEETFLTAQFGSVYQDYLAKVPRLVPSISPRTTGPGHYSWQKALYNREHYSAAFAALFVALLSVRFLLHGPLLR